MNQIELEFIRATTLDMTRRSYLKSLAEREAEMFTQFKIYVQQSST